MFFDFFFFWSKIEIFVGKWREAIVAIKTFPNLYDNPQQQKDVESEAGLMKSLRPHPNVVSFQGVCIQEKDVFLVFEYVAAGDLWSYLKKNEIEESKQFSLLHGIASGMLHLTSEGLIHRDLAARNVLLTQHLEPKISDFVRFFFKF